MIRVECEETQDCVRESLDLRKMDKNKFRAKRDQHPTKADKALSLWQLASVLVGVLHGQFMPAKVGSEGRCTY